MVLICILSHNNLPLTRACIASAMLQEYDDGRRDTFFGSHSLLIVDNASTDSTPQWLAANRGFSYIAFHERKSVAACWNYVLDWAFNPVNPCKYEGVLFLNNDTEIRPDTITWLMKDPAPFVTAVSVRSESELNYPSPPTTRRPHPDFSCFLIKPACWKKVGRFDEGFELAYCEDADYHVRMHMAGVEAVSLDLPFLHHGSQTVKHADPKEQRLIQRAADRNRARFEEMYGCLPGSEAYNAIFQE